MSLIRDLVGGHLNLLTSLKMTLKLKSLKTEAILNLNNVKWEKNHIIRYARI